VRVDIETAFAIVQRLNRSHAARVKTLTTLSFFYR
jgi:hypothetical protein